MTKKSLDVKLTVLMKIDSLYSSTESGDSLSLFYFGWLFILTVISGDGQLWLLLDTCTDIQVKLNTHLGVKIESSICEPVFPWGAFVWRCLRCKCLNVDISEKGPHQASPTLCFHNCLKRNSRVKSMGNSTNPDQLCKLAECNSLGQGPL